MAPSPDLGSDRLSEVAILRSEVVILRCELAVSAGNLGKSGFGKGAMSIPGEFGRIAIL